MEMRPLEILLEEPELIAKAQAGDQRAADALFACHLASLYQFIYFRIGRRSHEAEDVLQETLTAAVVALPRHRRASGFYTWLTGIARHKVADHFQRSMSRDRRTLGGTIGEEYLARLADDMQQRDLSAEELAASDVRAAVADALDGMTSDERSLLTAKYQLGLTVDEIAARDARTPKSVEAALFRARDAFRESFRAAARRRDIDPSVMRFPR